MGWASYPPASQSHLGQKRPLLSSSPTVNLELPIPSLNCVPKCHTHIFRDGDFTTSQGLLPAPHLNITLTGPWFNFLLPLLLLQVTELKSLANHVVVGNVSCETKDLFAALPQVVAVDINDLGTLKLSLEVTWK